MIRVLIISILFLGLGCSGLNFSEANLHGSWKAVLMTEGQDTFDYDISSVRLNFNENQTYSYQGNLNNSEAGNFHMIGKILYTKDTLNNSQEKAVEIMNLTADSLILKMNDQGNMRVLQMIRSNN